MKKLAGYIRSIVLVGALTVLCMSYDVSAGDEPEQSELYATSAVLMDAASGRVLYEKNGYEELPMASTTKIMTCILALERGNPDELVTVSEYAASQPKVRLGMKPGEQYRLGDLLYSLMLESHNDSAVAIAEHIGGSVEGFAKLMNQKAREIGCKNTYYITPNGLDAVLTLTSGDETTRVETHRTTATDLARTMAYCIGQSEQSEAFLEITRRADYHFSNQIVTEAGNDTTDGGHTVSCSNHNAFLGMMDGALSGKTGFTSKAGYCYVGALQKDGKTFTVALLACGWPNHKAYKWKDTRRLMEYGQEHYEYHAFTDIPLIEERLQPVTVINGQTERIGGRTVAGLKYKPAAGRQASGLLLNEEEEVGIVYTVPEELEAPVMAGSKVGSIKYMVNGEVWRTEIITTADTVEAIDYEWCLAKIIAIFLA